MEDSAVVLQISCDGQINFLVWDLALEVSSGETLTHSFVGLDCHSGKDERFLLTGLTNFDSLHESIPASQYERIDPLWGTPYSQAGVSILDKFQLAQLKVRVVDERDVSALDPESFGVDNGDAQLDPPLVFDLLL